MVRLPHKTYELALQKAEFSAPSQLLTLPYEVEVHLLFHICSSYSLLPYLPLQSNHFTSSLLHKSFASSSGLYITDSYKNNLDKSCPLVPNTEYRLNLIYHSLSIWTASEISALPAMRRQMALSSARKLAG